jgi:Nuclease-related domain
MELKPRVIHLRYAATCTSCNVKLARGALAAWDRTQKTATCSACLDASASSASETTVEVDRGIAGGSARREFQRRHGRRELQIRNRHKRLGSVIVALSSDPQSTTAWAVGARGEETVGHDLEALRAEGITVLHDRRIPGSRANIDHIVISPAGVFVVDPKNYRGKVEERDVGGLFRTDLRLYVGGRDKTKLVKGMDRQVAAVRAALAQDEKWSDVPVTPVLLFISPENWSFLNFRPLRFGETYVLWGEAFRRLLHAEQKIPHDAVVELERLLAIALPTR